MLHCAFTLLGGIVCVRGIVTGEGQYGVAWNRGSLVLVLLMFPLSMGSVFAWWYGSSSYARRLSSNRSP